MAQTEHSLKQYDLDLEGLRSRVLEMGGLVESQILAAINGLMSGDIRALADDSESKVARDVEWLQPGKLEGLDLVNFIRSGGTFGCFRLRRRPLLRPRIS